MKTIYQLIYSILFCIMTISLGAQQHNIPERKEAWVSSTLEKMSMEEKIGQMLMIRAHSNKGKEHTDYVEGLIKKHHIGSLCFFQGDPITQAKLTNNFQKLSKIPLIIAMDAEWGLGMRMKKTTISYPRQLTLGAISNNKEIYDMGKRIAYELKRLGVHLSFSPVADINNNPNNPVINNRSFGEDRYNVAAKSVEYMRGLQDAGVIACAKHFPGHGDTDTDSHLDLPVIAHSRKRLDSIELYPFRVMIDRGVKSMMVAHLHVPALDDRPNRPSTLSRATTYDLLQKKLGFKGLIITDAMEMKGVTKQFSSGQAEAEAILAGNDILCLPVNVPKTINYIKKYIEQGKISEAQIDHSVRKILEAKFDLGLMITPTILLNDLQQDLNDEKGLAIKGHLYEKSITLVRDDQKIIPYFQLNGKNYATLNFGKKSINTFQKRVESYVPTRHFNLPYSATQEELRRVAKELVAYDRVIISTESMSKLAKKNFGLTMSIVEFVKEIQSKHETTLVVFGSPYSLKFFDSIPTVLMAYTDDDMMQDRAAQALFGANDIRGRLPVTASPKAKFGTGLQRASLNRLGYGIPEEVGVYSDSLNRIDGLIEEMIKTKAAPGCQVLVAKDGKIIFNRAYGTKDYNAKHPVSMNDVYDIASITKIAGSTLAMMHLDDRKLVDIQRPLRDYIVETDTCDKKSLIIQDVISHHAGLASWIPFYTKTINVKSKSYKPLDKYYKKAFCDSYTIPVANNLFMRSDYVDTIWSSIYSSPLRKNKNYKYSDLGFYFAKKIIENTSGTKLDSYLNENYYRPLGLVRTGYNPWRFMPIEHIVPSEKDNYFRNQTVQGYVHDMGAAMLGGVSGHAGLFTNSYELAVIMQMLLNGGQYGGHQFLSEEVIKKYTTRHPRSTRRGIGFDMKELDKKKYLNMSPLAGDNTYGHLGFTGTVTFVDPDQNLVFVLLSNRTYPKMSNNLFGRKNFRPKVQSIIYESIIPTICIP